MRREVSQRWTGGRDSTHGSVAPRENTDGARVLALLSFCKCFLFSSCGLKKPFGWGAKHLQETSVSPVVHYFNTLCYVLHHVGWMDNLECHEVQTRRQTQTSGQTFNLSLRVCFTAFFPTRPRERDFVFCAHTAHWSQFLILIDTNLKKSNTPLLCTDCISVSRQMRLHRGGRNL